MASTTEVTFCDYYVIYGTRIFTNINTQNTTSVQLCTLDEIRKWFNNPTLTIAEISCIVNNCDANNVNIRPTYTTVIYNTENLKLNLGFGTGISVPGGVQIQNYRINFGIFWFPIESKYAEYVPL